MKRKKRYVKVTAFLLAAALFSLSGCRLEQLAETAALKIKEKTDTLFAAEKYSSMTKKSPYSFVRTVEETDKSSEDYEGEVQWHDAALSQAIAHLLGTPASEITYAQLEGVTGLDLSKTINTYGSVKSFEDLEYFTNLEALDIYMEYLDIETEDFSPIGRLTSLKYLQLDGVSIENPSFVGNLTELTELYMTDCGLTDISFVSGLEKLENVSFYGNHLLDISPLAGRNQLKILSLAHNKFLQDISPLAQLPALNEVGLHYCAISDVSPLQEAENLKMLNLSGNPISDLSVLGQMHQLEVLALEGCGLQEISLLSDMTQLKQLCISGNQLEDISPLSGMTNLNEIRLGRNRISDLTPIQNAKNLFRLDIFGNPIEKLPDNVLNVPYLNANGYYTWKYEKDNAVMLEEVTLAEALLGEYYPDEAEYAEDMISGYLNEDNYEDIVILAEQDDSYTRTFYTFLGDGNGNYTPAGAVSTSEAYTQLPDIDTYAGMLIANHNLIVFNTYQEYFGWRDNSFYQCLSGEMTLVRMSSLSYHIYYTGAEYCEYDFLNNTSSYSAYVKEDNEMKKMLLQSGDSTQLYGGPNSRYPELDLYYDFFCFPYAFGTVEEGFEAILQEEFTEYEQVPLEYTPETKANYTALSGVQVPEYYYTADGGMLYFAFMYLDEYKIIQAFAYMTDEGREYYLYNLETKEYEVTGF